MQNDAQVRAAEMREATDDCTTKIRTQLSADASGLEDDVIKGLASTNQLIKISSSYPGDLVYKLSVLYNQQVKFPFDYPIALGSD